MPRNYPDLRSFKFKTKDNTQKLFFKYKLINIYIFAQKSSLIIKILIIKMNCQIAGCKNNAE